MALSFPDQLVHSNDNYPIVDSKSVSGASFTVGSIAERDLIPQYARRLGQVVTVASQDGEGKVIAATYRYEGDDKKEHPTAPGVFPDYILDTDWKDALNWKDITQDVDGDGNIIQNAQLTADLTATLTVGNISQGRTFVAGTTLETILREMISPYIKPSLSSLQVSFAESGSVFEVGVEITVQSASWTTVVDSEGNEPTTFNLVGTGFSGQPINDVDRSLTALVGSKVQSLTPGIISWTLTAIGDRGDNLSRTFSISIRQRSFFGGTNYPLPASPTNAEVTEVIDRISTSRSLATSKNLTINSTQATEDAGDHFTYYIYPASYGDLSQVTQDGSSPVLSAFTKVGDFDYTNSYGVTASYRVYKSNAPGAFNVGTKLEFE
ncbi:hypothetical protein [Flammeovirga agarivorans]|uniref:Uncharacterized protein n=1 Tax=Flammeovirga agarivorans TaxID=2726742 RepID=A0A7X8SRB2_9BACT|nr:hypothetical protein [Flammeovirga agarivorans]NLR94854.1 hypothetical protein [Flammeovirga agarivorans]